MPSAYVKALKLPSAGGLKGHDLYQTLLDTVFSYKVNYEMTFPEMNWFPMLVQYAKELALPGKSKLLSGFRGAKYLTAL